MIELHNFDLNLLVAFDLLMEEKNVSRAAERMFVTQSAMSHTLAATPTAIGRSLARQDAGWHEAD